jgi:UDP-4-amino-4,6-dideoxy-N-acetyl-beta-L-altrosamine N-acetyltransferase
MAQEQLVNPPSPPSAIEGHLVQLRPIQRQDLALVLEWRNSTEVRKYLLNDRPISSEEHQRWFESLVRDARKHVFMIVSREGQPVGLAQLFDIDRENGHADWGFYIADPALRGSGMGAEAEYLVLYHAFDEVGLQRVYCHTLASNRPVLAMHERFQFRKEGVLRRHVRREGWYEDLVVMGMLREEFEQARPLVASIFRAMADRRGEQQP